jgi:hypothetical protein
MEANVTIMQDQLQALSRFRAPSSIPRRLLAYVHSGEVMRSFLPTLLRTSAVTFLLVYVLAWGFLWPTVYKEFERWGLLRAFFSQMIALATVFLAARVTMLRARHLEASPADDFVAMRAMSLLCRWFAEVTVVVVLGIGLATVLQPLSVTAMLFAPSEGGAGGGILLSFLSGAVSMSAVALVGPVFLLLYTFATVIDLAMAVEFNTRAERAAKG